MNTTTAIPAKRIQLLNELVAAIEALPKKTTAALDALGEPLVAQLIEEGVITAESHIEWAGYFEHDVVAIFWCQSVDEDRSNCLNVNMDGSIDLF
jgi:hypothetical protein